MEFFKMQWRYYKVRILVMMLVFVVMLVAIINTATSVSKTRALTEKYNALIEGDVRYLVEYRVTTNLTKTAKEVFEMGRNPYHYENYNEVLDEIIQMNSIIINPDFVKYGTIILVPVYSDNAEELDGYRYYEF